MSIQELFKDDGFIGRSEDYSGLRLQVFGQFEAMKYEPGDDEVCISISSKNYGIIDPELSSEFLDILRLNFADITNDDLDDPTVRTINKDEAKSVIKFVQKHMNKKKLIIHCYAGVSRSRTMAGALAICFDLPYVYTMINRTVQNAIFEAYLEITGEDKDVFVEKVRKAYREK